MACTDFLQAIEANCNRGESTGFPEVASAVLLQRSIWLVRSDDVIITVEQLDQYATLGQVR
jgi:hypothetical protein